MKLKLQTELIKLQVEFFTDYINMALIETYEELCKLLNYMNKDDQTLFFYLNRNKIQDILLTQDTIVEIDKENIDYTSLKSLFYLSLAIKNDRFVINYSYNKDFIKALYSSIKKEGNKLKKLLLYITFDIIFNNYKQLDESDDSLTNEEIDEITEEVNLFLNQQLPILNEYELFLHKKDDDLIDIENIYSGIIIWLIRNKKFDDYKYIEDIMTQLDLGNIELTNNMFKEIKKEFDENSKENYINKYKIINFESLNNENIINFYCFLLKFVFKNNIYIYNIDFLLETKKTIHNLLNKDYDRIKRLITRNEHEPNPNFDEKKAFILKTLLDSEYYYSGNESKILYEVLEYYKHYEPEKEDEIKEIEEEIENINQKKGKKNMRKYLELYTRAKKMNIRYELLKYIYDEKNNDKKLIQDSFLKDIVAPWENHIEKYIRDNKSNFSKFKLHIKIFKLLFKYFSDENNKKTILKIFTQEQVDNYMKNFNSYYNLKIVKTYFENYLFESKKEDIQILSGKKFNNNNLDEYLKYANKAKQMKSLYKFLKEVFNINKKTITEEGMNNILKKWEEIKNMLQEKKFDIEDENIKINLFIYFNNEKNQKKHNKILNEESYNFLLEKKEEATKELLNCYEIFLPEKKEELSRGVKNEKLEEYSDAKDMNSFIFDLIGEKKEKTENYISTAKEKWNNIISFIKNKEYDNIDKNDKLKIINFFKNKKNRENKIIKQTSIVSYIEAFIDNENKGEKQEKKSENKKKNSLENKNKIGTIFQTITMLLCYKNKNLNIEIIWKNDILFKKEQINLLYNDDKLNNIFDYINEIEEILNQNYTDKFPIIFKLIVEEKDKNFLYKYEFLDLKQYLKGKIKFFASKKEKSSGDSFLDEFKKFLSEISKNNDKESNNNDKIFRAITDKILKKRKEEEDSKTKNKNRDGINERVENNKSFQNNEATMTFDVNFQEEENNNELSKKADKSKVLEFLKIIGNHNDANRMYTPEYINQINNYWLLSSGTNSAIKIYNRFFEEETGKTKEEMKEWVFSLCKRDKGKNNETEYIACLFKEICLLKFFDNQLKEDKRWNVPNMTCLSCAEVKIKGVPKQQKKKKNKKQKDNEEQISEFFIVAGRSGVKYIVDAFKDRNKDELETNLNNFYIARNNTFRNILKLSESRIAYTSNAIIPDGVNKLIIYDFNKNESNIIDKSKRRGDEEYSTNETEKEERFSFIASNNGMACFNENVLLCACKKYTKEDQNGILLVLVNKNEKESKVEKKFYDTKDFEVYCFCHLLSKKDAYEQKINERTVPHEKVDYFFVGGFDKNLREGKIKLYRYERENNEIKTIKFLQDIEFGEKDEVLTEIEKKNNVKVKKFEGFGGAINSIILYNCTNILASCYDGKVYLLSKPNLQVYNVNLNN